MEDKVTTWEERVEKELEDLETKITGLSKFLNNDAALDAVSNTHLLLLFAQFATMTNYAGILGRRLMLSEQEKNYE